MAIQVEATFSQSHPNAAEWVELMSSGVSPGAKLGTELFATGLLQQWKEEKKEAAFVLDQLHEQPLHLS